MNSCLNSLTLYGAVSKYYRHYRLEITTLDGQNRRILLDKPKKFSDIALDSKNEQIYFCDAASVTIERIKYDGGNHTVII